MPDLDRRTFLRGTVASGFATWAARASTQRAGLNVILVRAVTPDRFADGIAFGFDEAVRSARLFERTMTMDRHIEVAPGDSSIVISTLQDPVALSECATSISAPVLNVACSSDRVRTHPCPRNLFHVMPSASTLKLADSASSSTRSLPRVEVWHHGLERFGAGQLNERFARELRRPMASADWVGWMALKITVDAWLRIGAASADAFFTAFTDGGLRFDGHKGTALYFRPADRELHQPLYLVVNDEPRDMSPPETGRANACARAGT